jgi:type II secretory pathway component GspD/PulD (secretin)
LEQIRRQSGEEGQARFEVYRTGGAGGYQLLSTLQTLVPGAKLSTDPKTGNLVAWATAAEHDRLKAALAKLTRGAAADEEAEIEVYRLTRGDPKAAINLLQEMMPGAKLSLDPQTGSIIALAIPQDQKRIRDALERLQQAAPAEDKRLAAYTLKSADPAVVVEMLEKLFPGAKFVSDRRTGKLAVLAAPADQEAIKAAIEDLDSGPAQPQGPEKVVTYHAPKGSTTLALEVLREMVPTARFQADKWGGAIVAWARQDEHETIKRVLEDLSGESDPEKRPTLEVYPIDVTAAQRLYNALAAIVPNARLSLDTAGQRLVVWATGKEHELVKQAIVKLEAGGTAASSKRLAVYRLTKTDPASLVNLLQNVAPNARVAVDRGTQSVVVFASEADQKAVQQMVEQLEKSAEGERDQLVSYPLKSADATTMLTVLQKMFPRAQFVHDRRANRLAVTAKAEEHEAIRSAIEELDKGPPAGEGPEKVQTYQLPKGGATLAMEVLRELVPGARFQVDRYGGVLVAWAREAEHETIKRVLEDLSGENDPEKKPRLEVYPIDVTNRQRLYYMLSPMVPEAKLTIDADSGNLVVWGTPKDHQTIQQAIAKLGIGGAAAGSRQMVAYQLTKADPQTVLTLLQTLLPTAKLAVDSRTQTLVAVATEADHQSIRKLLDQLQPEKPGPNDPELRVYPVKSADLDNVVKAAGKLYPNAQFIADRRGRRILVMARLDDQPGIEKLLQQLDSGQPGDAEESLAVYTIHKGDAKTVATMLQQIFPDMYFGADLKTGAVIARGTGADQQALAKVIERLNLPDEEHRPVVVSYGTGSADPTTVQAMLTKLVPTATITADAKTRTVVALATKREHELIRDAVDRLIKGGEGTAFKAATYSIEAATPAAAIALLKEAAPGAIIAEGAEPRQIVAWAREEDHKVIAELVAQLAKQGPDESSPRVEVYNLRSGSAAGFVMALKVILPEARCGVGSNPRQLVAYARPADHKRIAEIVEKMSEREAPEVAPQIRLYTLRSTGAAAAAKALAAALPEAQFSVGADPSQLIAYARPADQQIIKAAVEEMEREGLADSRRVLSVYPMKAKDAQALLGVLDPKLLAEARVLADPERDGLIVWAEPRQHEAIRSAVEQFKKQMPEANEPTARVYRFRRAEPKAAQAAIAKLVPNAQVGVDLINRALVVSALPQDHQKIAEAVRQLDEETENSPRLQMHRLASADPLGLLPVLQALFKQRTDVQLAADSSRDAIIAVAPPADHELIRTLIEQVEKAATDHQAKLQLYSLRDIDSTAALDVITKVLDKLGGKAELTVEPYSNQLIAIARPEHHELIAQTLERLKSDERHLEIIALDNVDPNTATLAINRLFAGERLNSPEVQVDPATQQLFIRGSKEQIARIRQLLVKLGETSLAVQPSGTGPIRTIQFQGDAQEAIEQLQRIWPQLRDNPIRIVTPSAIAPLLRKSREATPAPKQPGESPPNPSADKLHDSPEADSPSTAPADKPQQRSPENPQQPSPESPQQPPPAENHQQPPPAKDAKQPSGAAGLIGPATKGFPVTGLFYWIVDGTGFVSAAESGGEPKSPQSQAAPLPRSEAPQPPASASPPSQPQPPSQAQQEPSDNPQQEPSDNPRQQPQPEAPQEQPQPKAPQEQPQPEAPQEQPQPKAPQSQPPPSQQSSQPPAEDAEEEAPQSKPGAPILIAISDGNVVIASDDLEALDQFEMLLRALSQRSGAPGRNFAVYPLRNTSAARVAATLQQVFRTAQPATPDGTTTRTGRATSSVVIVPDERTNSLLVQANRTDRATIENLLKLLDVGDLPNADQRKPRTIAIKNTSAARVEQIIRSVFKADLGAAAGGGGRGAGSGPSWLATEIVVDELTNSLLVTGPPAMLDHIEQFARHLDQAAGEDTSRELTIIPLKKANAARVQAILDSMLGKPSSGSAGRPRSVVPTAPRSQSGSRKPTSHGGSTPPAAPPPKNY